MKLAQLCCIKDFKTIVDLLNGVPHAAEDVIIANKDFLNQVSERQAPNVPAHIAADFLMDFVTPLQPPYVI